MALDTRGLASGFAQGFGLMDQHYARQHSQALQDKQSDRADRRMEMTEQQFAGQQEDAQRKRATEQAKFTLGKIAQGVELSDDEMQFLKENPQYWPALDPKTDAAIEAAQRVIDPNDPLGANDPEALYSMNALFSHRINRGEGGRKRIAGVYPGQSKGTVAIDLEVEGPDGKTYNAPMTRNRGVAGDDDEVLETPVEALVNQVQGYRVLRNAFRGEAAQQNAARVLAALTGKNPGSERYSAPFEHPQLGWVQAGPDGQLKQLDKPGASSKAPADVKTAEWLVASGIAPDNTAAWNMLSTARSDPSRFVSSYVTQAMKAQEMLMPDEQKSQPELVEEGMAAYRQIMNRAHQSGGPDDGAPKPKGLELVGGSAQVLPKDGSAVKQDDGSYSGRVNREGTPPASGLATQAHSKQPANPAPPEAVKYLQQNPQFAADFEAKYGYLPEGF
ncbi:hypothetical protein [Marinobacter sp. MDS2]|uniref:hypothetical protein n=1 Tax=Marinobacter sp. MDS2 TaxID=3065961 RepID=UPI00273C023F|nr:hypothetical protein [Marinobacter sp. MDS2]MDP4546476.1 hypothetical protein [Marinobacter sp. MDS2]